MGSPLPELGEREFLRRLAACLETCRPERHPLETRRPALPGTPASDPGGPALDRVGAALYRHYVELRRWNPKVSLVGPGTAAEIVARHYGESLAGLELLDAGDPERQPPLRLVDLGSGAGFPGLVLAAAWSILGGPADVTLIEPREKKRLFLKAASRRMGLSCRCLDARVERSLPEGLPDTIDVITCRALATSPGLFELFFEHSPRARFLLWCGAGAPELPSFLEVQRQISLAGSLRRRILEIRVRGGNPEGVRSDSPG